jgi:tRNA A37 threonylcarbamoyladenosine dehydratase
MFERLELLIGKDNLNKIQSTKVLIVGVGGVGGECALSLVRSGIKSITIIDFDKVDISNINRQVVAFHSTIGKKKVDVLESIIKDINPECNVSKYDIYLDKNNIKEIFDNETPDFIIDCCDSKETKKEIIKESLNRNIRFISSMGTGCKMDPSKLEITDIRKTNNDPLARIFRKWIKDEKINKKIPVLCSTEVPVKSGRAVASNSFVPNSAGLLISSYVIRKIIND